MRRRTTAILTGVASSSGSSPTTGSSSKNVGSGSSSFSKPMYVASVKLAVWWPSHVWTCLAFRPRGNRMVAHVWRSVRSPAHGTPAFLAAALTARSGSMRRSAAVRPCDYVPDPGEAIRTPLARCVRTRSQLVRSNVARGAAFRGWDNRGTTPQTARPQRTNRRSGHSFDGAATYFAGSRTD